MESKTFSKQKRRIESNNMQLWVKKYLTNALNNNSWFSAMVIFLDRLMDADLRKQLPLNFNYL